MASESRESFASEPSESNIGESFAESLMRQLFGLDPAFVEFMASLQEFARNAEQQYRDFSLVKASELSSPINGRF